MPGLISSIIGRKQKPYGLSRALARALLDREKTRDQLNAEAAERVTSKWRERAGEPKPDEDEVRNRIKRADVFALGRRIVEDGRPIEPHHRDRR